jgi:hypothetical protein
MKASSQPAVLVDRQTAAHLGFLAFAPNDFGFIREGKAYLLNPDHFRPQLALSDQNFLTFPGKIYLSIN